MNDVIFFWYVSFLYFIERINIIPCALCLKLYNNLLFLIKKYISIVQKKDAIIGLIEYLFWRCS